MLPILNLDFSKTIHLVTKFSGWWYNYPSEKYENQMGILFTIYGKIKNVPNRTTNQ